MVEFFQECGCSVCGRDGGTQMVSRSTEWRHRRADRTRHGIQLGQGGPERFASRGGIIHDKVVASQHFLLRPIPRPLLSLGAPDTQTEHPTPARSTASRYENDVDMENVDRADMGDSTEPTEDEDGSTDGTNHHVQTVDLQAWLSQ